MFRCVGTGKDRGYLAWQPTRTEQPNFHIPKVFGWLIFEG
ncbi:MAG: carbohydrate-binding family 9-like protein [Pyrinomonadaceae bacterium]